ncbi:MAG: Hpt domain-containing protein [Candidatus Binataceae bacterium]|jgi:HPt (histidine-containing phosphotransfer) domain-containing protein
MPNSDDGLDHEIIDDLKDISADPTDDVIPVLLGMFFQELPARITAIRTLARAPDLSELARAAHRMKGSSALIGASRLAGICGALESIGDRVAAPEAMEDLLSALEVEAQRVRLILPQALGHADAVGRRQDSGLR